jgi:hypothetical protein
VKHYRVKRALHLPGKLERERGLPAARLAVEQCTAALLLDKHALKFLKRHGPAHEIVRPRAWNLAVSLYYKAGGLPWRPADLPSNVCFVGISFHHLKRRARNDDFSFKSATKLRPQMVYELNEKSTI